MGPAEHVRELVEPILARLGPELFDVEHQGAVLRVCVDRPGGVDLDALSDATRAVSAALDADDPFPGRYTLEVSSPGLERPLRTPAQFRRFVGTSINVCLPLSATANAARTATSVLPKPTSPHTSRSIGCGETMSWITAWIAAC